MDSYEWFQSRVHTCDYLIFVDSEAARNLTDAHLQNKTYRERRTGPRGDVFLYGLKHILFSEQVRERATVLVSFHGNHCQRYLQASKVFMLPGDFPYFLQKIHGFSAADAAVLSVSFFIWFLILSVVKFCISVSAWISTGCGVRGETVSYLHTVLPVSHFCMTRKKLVPCLGLPRS